MNARHSILLLLLLYFSLGACSSSRPFPVYSPSSSRPRIEPPANPREAPVEEPIEAAAEEPKEADALRQKVVDYAQQFVGTRYKAAGKNPSGFDCSGFTGYVMGNFGIQLSASSKYQEKDGIPIPVSEVQAGDLIFFRREPNGTVFHVSLVISNDQDGLYVVHSTSSRGVVIDNIHQSSYWKSKHATACRVIK
jgi:cell wall-associated NlpC family hydrolase